MRIGSILFLSAAFLFMVSCSSSDENKGKSIGDLHVSKAEPQPGDVLKLNFNPVDSSLAKEDDIDAYYYTLVNDKAYAYDLELERSDKGWAGKVTIPDSATAVAFNFKKGSDEFYTNNGKGYVLPLFTAKGKVLPASFASISHYYDKVGSSIRLDLKPDSILTWLQSYFKTNPEVKNYALGRFGQLLYTKNKTEGETYIKNRLKTLSQKDSLSLNEYREMGSLYGVLKKKAQADSVMTLLKKKYPQSRAAQLEYAMRFNKAKTHEEKVTIYKAYTQKIGNHGSFNDFMLGRLAQYALSQQNMEAFENYVSQLSNPRQAASIYNSQAWNLAESGKNLDQAEKMAKKAVSLVDPDKNTEKIDYMTEEQYDDMLERASDMYKDTYALILFKQGKVKQAVKQQEDAVEEGENPEINERYIKYLMAAEAYEDVTDEAADFIKEGHSTAKIKAAYKTAYVKVNGSEKGLEAQLKNLEEKAHQKLVAEVKEQMFNKKAPEFTLTDSAGNTVTLADLKGKVVVLDFWATWCGPCRASFPGMAKAVNFYKDSTDVQFYFVNTFQREPKEQRHKKVKNFVAEHDYPFEVLFDPNKNNNFLTASAFGITGIPTKVILDKNGKWRFTKVGWGGSTAHLVEEVKVMIGLID